MADLHDMSSFRGTFSRFAYRWKYPIMFCTIVLIGGMGLFLGNLLLTEPEIPESTFVTLGSKLVYHGNATKFEDRYFDPFPMLPSPERPTSSSLMVDTIEIKWVRISGPELTSQLSLYASTLRVLHLENVTIEGHLQPTILPVLEEFFLQQGLEPEEVKNADYVMNNGPTPWVHSTLFFLNDSSPNLAKKMAKAYTQNINVTVYLKGSVNYQLNPGANEVKLDNADCTEILTSLPRTVKTLTVGRCSDLTPTAIPPEVTFLNIYIVSLTTARLSEILKNLINLEEFYAEIPDGPVDISLEDLSPTLRIFSVSSMRILHSGNKSYPMIKEFYFGSENQYGWIPNRVTSLNEGLLQNFGNIFPNVEKVGLFDLRNGERYTFLESVLKSSSVNWIGIENFLRGTNGSLDSAVGAYDFVEGQLDELSLAKDASDIVIETSWFGKRTGRDMTHMEKLWYRYTKLGWSPIDSWAKYQYVQKIIEGGGIL